MCAKRWMPSLDRLQTDFIDVYLFHQFDPKTPVEDGLAALNEVAQSGKARAGGCSNYKAEQLQNVFDVSRRLGLRRFEVTEPPYSLAARDIENDLLPSAIRSRSAFSLTVRSRPVFSPASTLRTARRFPKARASM